MMSRLKIAFVVSLTFWDYALYLWPLTISPRKNENYFQSCRRASISSLHIDAATWFWSLNNTACFGFDKLPFDTLYWMSQKNTTHQPRYIFILYANTMIKFGKCAHWHITRTKLRKIHPPKIGLKWLPETAERFNRGTSVAKYTCVPVERGSCVYNIISARVLIVIIIVLNFIKSFIILFIRF